jgi:hypothetical protein
MPVFRVEKNKSYTVMSNHHLKDRTLSLKSKGLLSQMLSLPEDWDYTLAGLASINKESKDAIRSAVKELEDAGYVVRRQTTDKRGKFSSNEYVIYEFPQSKQSETEELEPPLPPPEAPLLENPTTEKPMAGNPLSGNPTQLSTKEQKTKRLRTDVINSHSYPIVSYPSSRQGAKQKRKDSDGMDMDGCREELKEQISFDLLCEGRPGDKDKLTEILELMAETLCSAQSTMRIAGSTYPASLVKERFRSLNSLHMEYVLNCLEENPSMVRNIKQYLKTVLFNAPATMNNYYAAQVNFHRQFALNNAYSDLFV